MTINPFRWLKTAVGTSKIEKITYWELLDAAEDYWARELAFNSCVNLIANALGRCDFRDYRNGKEDKRGREHWIWNYDPNVNQNSTQFIHKLVYRLYSDNEALIVSLRRRNGMDALAVADSWQVPDPQVTRQDSYKGVTVGQLTFEKTFWAEDVIHLQLNHCNVKPVLDGLSRSWTRLLAAAMNNYVWANGQHWKVTVSQIATGRDGWMEEFQQMVEKQIKPFLTSAAAVLPELDGYKYEVMGKATDAQRDAAHIKSMVQDIMDFTADAFLIPPVLLRGQVEGIADANSRFLTNCIDPLADQITEEVTKKRYGYDAWRRGSYMRVDTSAIQHFNLFDLAPNIEKLIGSGYSYNDVQRAAGGQEIDEPWANEHFLTKNFARAEELLKGEVSENNGANSEGSDGGQAAD